MPDDLVPLPPVGRRYVGRRRVRLGDASPGGRLRLDALARYLQDVSNDDTRDAGLDDDMAWVVRRTVVVVERFAVFGDELSLTTFCGGLGRSWAERRVSVRDAGAPGAAMDAATLWVHLDEAQRPSPLTTQFHELFAEAAQGRTVRPKLLHQPPGDAELAGATPWPVRFTDFDVLGHMNNAAYWAVVEDELARRRDLRAPLRAELEFRASVEPGHEVRVARRDGDGSLAVWLVGAGGLVHASAVVQRLGPDAGDAGGEA